MHYEKNLTVLRKFLAERKSNELNLETVGDCILSKKIYYSQSNAYRTDSILCARSLYSVFFAKRLNVA